MRVSELSERAEGAAVIQPRASASAALGGNVAIWPPSKGGGNDTSAFCLRPFRAHLITCGYPRAALADSLAPG